MPAHDTARERFREWLTRQLLTPKMIDAIAAQAAALFAPAAASQSLHQQIMNLPCGPPHNDTHDLYKRGHRDARRAAAELVATQASALFAAAGGEEGMATACLELALQELPKAEEGLGKYFEHYGAEHEDDDCPQDDGCECELVAGVNIGFGRIKVVLQAIRAWDEARRLPPTPPAASGSERIVVDGRECRFVEGRNVFGETVCRIEGFLPLPGRAVQCPPWLDHQGQWRELGTLTAGTMIDWPTREAAVAFATKQAASEQPTNERT